MAISYFPFNSIMVNGVADRPANAENLAAYLAAFFKNGVLSQDGNSLKVEAAGGMDIQILAGAGCINGKTLLSDAAEVITIENASATLDRIDRVVLRLNEADRLMELDVLKGTPASSPEAPEITRTTNIYELCLAEVLIPAGTTNILAGYIMDTRAHDMLCGYVQLPHHMQGIEYGGTGASSAAGARQAINFIGVNPISSPEEDTPAKWAELGKGVAHIHGNAILNEQPYVEGFVENIVSDEHGIVFQIFHGIDAYFTDARRIGWSDEGKWSYWIGSLSERTGMQMVELWQNANVESSFPAQDIYMDVSGYDALLIYHKSAVGQIGISAGIIKRSLDGKLINSAAGTSSPRTRVVSFSGSKVTFYAGYNGTSKDNESCIPESIYGIKGVQK